MLLILLAVNSLEIAAPPWMMCFFVSLCVARLMYNDFSGLANHVPRFCLQIVALNLTLQMDTRRTLPLLDRRPKKAPCKTKPIISFLRVPILTQAEHQMAHIQPLPMLEMQRNYMT